jgi:hypothetical protein
MADGPPQQAQGGFVFDNVARNAMLERSGYKMPGAVKTGTTIVGIVFKVGRESVPPTMYFWT